MAPILSNRGFTLIEMLVAGMILSIIVGLSFFSMSFYLNEWQYGRLGDIRGVEEYRQKQLVTAAVESAWEYYVTDPANERLNNYYPYFKGTDKSAAFVTTSPAFENTDAAAARILLEDLEKDAGTALIYEEAPLDKFYIRYYNNKIDYSYSLRLKMEGKDLRLRYYGLSEIRFLPQQDDFEEIMAWQTAFDGKERHVMPEIVEIVDASDKGRKVFRFDIRARNRQKGGLYIEPY